MAEFVNFASGTITDNPLTVGATQINSAAFATVLPPIAAPHTVSIVLDPLADDGPPEIVVVTAHAAGTTQVTAIRGQQTSLGGNVARAHAAATKWVLAATALDLNRVAGDPGDLKAGIWSSPPDGWLLMGQSISGADVTYPALWAVVPAAWKTGTTLNLPNMDGRVLMGQSISGADVTYPALWAVVPAAWKTGTTLNLPNMDGRVLMGGSGTLGSVGGANLHTLATANLPAHTHALDHNHGTATSASSGVAHTHAIDHNHGTVTSAAQSASHTHTINHDHGSVTSGSQTSTHNHTLNAVNNSTAGATGQVMIASSSGTATTINTSGEDVGETHEHAVNLPAYTGTSGTQSASHTHAVDMPNYAGASGAASATAHTHTVDLPIHTGPSGSTGSGTAVDHTPLNLRINVAIKT
jgi:microcystin-dependent protein